MKMQYTLTIINKVCFIGIDEIAIEVETLMSNDTIRYLAVPWFQCWFTWSLMLKIPRVTNWNKDLDREAHE